MYLLCSMQLKMGKDLMLAYRLLVDGQPVAIPTETVYGLAANVYNEDAIAQVFDIKQRPKFDPLIVHCANFEDALDVADNIPEPLAKLAKAFWPGPLTIVVEKNKNIPDLVTAGLNTVAIRVPNHPLTLDLLYGLPFPVAAPSANPFSYVSPTNAFHVLDQLGDKIEYIIDGEECTVGLESTICRFANNEIEIMRLGGLSVEEIEAVSDFPVVVLANKDRENTPGSFKKHYSNNKELVLVENANEIPVLNEGEAAVYFKKPDSKVENQLFLSENGDTKEAAKNLFRVLRELDKDTIFKVYVELAPTTGLGPAINERLKRAAEV